MERAINQWYMRVTQNFEYKQQAIPFMQKLVMDFA
jgi:hypothetical protein